MYIQSNKVNGTVLKNVLNGECITITCSNIDNNIAPQSRIFVNIPILNKEMNSERQFKTLNIW